MKDILNGEAVISHSGVTHYSRSISDAAHKQTSSNSFHIVPTCPHRQPIRTEVRVRRRRGGRGLGRDGAGVHFMAFLVLSD